MNGITTKKENCKSCGYCMEACPRKAISFSGQLNALGYPYISVNESDCVLCGNCYIVCPDLVFEFHGGEAVS